MTSEGFVPKARSPREAGATRRIRRLVIASLVALLGLMGAFFPNGRGYAATLTLGAVEDTYSSKMEPSTTHGSRAYVYATTTGASNTAWENAGYLKFDTRSTAASTVVSSVSLRLYVVENDLPQGTPIVWADDGSWSEASLDWSNEKPSGTKILNGPVSAPAGAWVTIPLSPSLSVHTGGYTAFQIGYTLVNSNFRFASRESGNAPQLVVNASTQSAASSGSTGTTAAPAASSAGYNNLVFDDEFNSLDSIDLTGRGAPGHNWYTDRPFGFPAMPASDLSVSNGVLTLNQSFENLNYGLSTFSKRGNVGTSYQYGYFEARMAFDETNASKAVGFPSFWGVERNYMTGSNTSGHYGEFDVAEAWHPSYQPYSQKIIAGTIHDWSGGQDHMTTGNNVYYAPASFDVTQFHTYAALWTPGQVSWYVDGVMTLTQSYSASRPPVPNYLGHPAGTYSVLDAQTDGQVMILGSAPGLPMKVDYVRIYH